MEWSSLIGVPTMILIKSPHSIHNEDGDNTNKSCNQHSHSCRKIDEKQSSNNNKNVVNNKI